MADRENDPGVDGRTLGLIRDSARPDVPEDERFGMTAEYVSQLPVPEREQFDEALGYLLTNANSLQKSAMLAGDGYFGLDTIFNPRRRNLSTPSHVAVLELNEYGLVPRTGEQSRYRERPTSGFDFLKNFVASMDVIKAIILTRQRQVVPLLRWKRERDQSPYGCRIVRRDNEKTTDADRPRIQRVERFLEHGGDVPERAKREKLRRPRFQEFVRKLIFDTLSADACPVELSYTASKKLSGIYNVDYQTVRLCTELGYEGDDSMRAVQLIDDEPFVGFTFDEMLYRIRNPRSDIHVGGYGYAEPEMVIRAATAYINAISYNAAGVDRNAIPRGVLTVFGDYGQRGLDAFKANMKAMLTGASQRWTIPILASKTEKASAAFTPIDLNFNDMYMARWMTLLVSIICAVYGIEPSEIHFDSFSIRPSSLAGSDTAEKLALSHDKGFVPLVAFVEAVVDEIVEVLDPEYTFEFVGLYDEDKDKEHERNKLSSTIDEIREIDGRDPHPDPDFGAAPSNPALMQLYMQKKQMEMQQQMAGMGAGAPGDEGDDPSFDFDDGQGGDYPEGAGGEHDPYGGGNPPDDEHFHTLSLGDDEGPDQRTAPREVRKAKRPGDGFMVIVERGHLW